MPEDKLVRVTGMASSMLLEPEQPLAPANRRISIMVLTHEAEERLLGTSRAPVPAEPDAATPPAAEAVSTTPAPPADAAAR